MFINDDYVSRTAGKKVSRLIRTKMKIIDFTHEHGFDPQTFNQWISGNKKAKEYAETYKQAIMKLLGLTAEELDELDKTEKKDV